MNTTATAVTRTTRRVRSTRKYRPPAKYQRVKRREILSVGEKERRGPRPYPELFRPPPMREVKRGVWEFVRPGSSIDDNELVDSYEQRARAKRLRDIRQPWEPRP